jgi:hypothetical protein
MPEQEVHMARRKQAAAETVKLHSTQDEAPQAPETASSAVTAEPGQGQPEPGTTRLPDPREQRSVSLDGDRQGPRLRLLRSHRFNQVQIRSDEELPEAQRERLKAAGWTERAEEGIWTKQLPTRKHAEGEEPKPAWPTVVEAERLFQDIANDIRAGKGLPAVTQETGR